MRPTFASWALAGLSLLLMTPVGCASHADFVNVRQDLREAIRAQRDYRAQARKREETLQRRVQALEVTKESSGRDDRLDLLAQRVQRLEERLSQLREMEGSPAVSPLKPSESVGDFPSLSPPDQSLPGEQSESTLSSLLGITPTSAFNLAYNDYLNGRYDLSIVGFQRFLEDFPSTSLAPKARYWLGESYYHKKDYVRAMHAFERVVRDHPTHDKVPSALYKVGLAAAETGHRAKARAYLKRVIEEHSTSKEANLAKHKLAELR